MSSVHVYSHPTHHGHVEWVKGGGHVMTHKWAHGGPDVRKTYSSAEKAKSALHRAVKAGNVPARTEESRSLKENVAAIIRVARRK